MSWTYYTAPLAPGEDLTAAQWYELCEALAERITITGRSPNIDLTVAASMKNSRLGFRQVPLTTGGTTPWTELLKSTQNDWTDSDSVATVLTTSTGNYFTTATEWTAEGLASLTEWDTLKTAVAAGWGDHRYWNIIRATIQRLQIAIIQPASGTLYEKQIINTTSWASTMAAYAAAGETTSSGTGGLRSALLDTQKAVFNTTWICRTARQECVYTKPSVATLASCEAWSFYTTKYDVTYPPTPALGDSVDWSLSGASGSTALVTATNALFSFGTGVDLRGTKTLSVRLGSYADPTAYEPFYSGPSVLFNNYVDFSYVGALYIAPTWAKS